MLDCVKIRGMFRSRILRRRKSGVLEPISGWEEFNNGMTTVGLTAAASVELGGGIQVTTWYMGLIDNSGFSALAAGDTMASHAGWAELTNYTETVRQTLTFSAAAGGIIQTSSPCAFTISGSRSVIGAFLVSNSTKGGSTGTLRAHGTYAGGAQSLINAQVFEVNYSSTYAAG